MTQGLRKMMVNNNIKSAAGQSSPDISILVPVYNIEAYLSRCLDLVFNQQFSGSFEVITVDDALTDASLEILKSYAKKQHNYDIYPDNWSKI